MPFCFVWAAPWLLPPSQLLFPWRSQGFLKALGLNRKNKSILSNIQHIFCFGLLALILLSAHWFQGFVDVAAFSWSLMLRDSNSLLSQWFWPQASSYIVMKLIAILMAVIRKIMIVIQKSVTHYHQKIFAYILLLTGAI